MKFDRDKWFAAKILAEKKYSLSSNMLLEDWYYNLDAIFLTIKEYSALEKSTLVETFLCVADDITKDFSSYHPTVVKWFKRWKKLNKNLTSNQTSA
jgi:hypothetical protein